MSQIILALIFIVVIIVRREGLLGQREMPLDRLFARDGPVRRTGGTPPSRRRPPPGHQRP